MNTLCYKQKSRNKHVTVNDLEKAKQFVAWEWLRLLSQNK